MEVLAENRFTVTKSLCYEGMRRMSERGGGKFTQKALLFLAAAWVVLTAVTLWLGQSFGYMVIEFIVFSMLALWMCVLLPRNRSERAFKTLKQRYGDDLERTVRLYGDRLTVNAAGTQTEVRYSEITQLLYSRRLLILVTEDNAGILLKRDSFTVGDEAAAQDLIRKANAEVILDRAGD